MIHFVAYKQRTTPVVEGRVKRVCADAVTDGDGQYLFLGHSRGANRSVSPGSQCETLSWNAGRGCDSAGNRAMPAFFLQPFTDSFARAFHEE
jgi:HlyD family secretion protein/epimerase transport system membrane fusion protein